MAREMIRPKIEVEAVYQGNENMQEVFVGLLVSEVKYREKSICTFDYIKDPEYNVDKKHKEAS